MELLTTAGIREHLRLAEVAGRKADMLQDQFGLVASILLVPTFIAGMFGANTQIPGEGHWSGFIGMLLLMAIGAGVTFAFFRAVKAKVVKENDPSGEAQRCGSSGPGVAEPLQP